MINDKQLVPLIAIVRIAFRPVFSQISVSIIAMVLILSICLASSKVFSENSSGVWEKIREENNVVVFSQEINGSDIIKVKAEVVIDANMQLIQSTIDDVSYRQRWVPYLAESRILKEYSVTEKLEYSHFSAPWPASDRDFIYRQRLLHKDNKKIIFVLSVVESELMPERNGIVRADMMESKYTLTALTDKRTKVELIFYADPKGWLPDWLINKIQQVLPYAMLRNLKIRTESLRGNI